MNIEMPELDGPLVGYVFRVAVEYWYDRPIFLAAGRPLTVAVVLRTDTYIHENSPKSYATRNPKSILRAARKAKKTALANMKANAKRSSKLGHIVGTYPPKKLSDL